MSPHLKLDLKNKKTQELNNYFDKLINTQSGKSIYKNEKLVNNQMFWDFLGSPSG